MAYWAKVCSAHKTFAANRPDVVIDPNYKKTAINKVYLILKFPLSVMKWWIKGAATLSITILSITTLSIKGLHVTLSISDTQHNNALPLCWVLLCWVSRFIYYYAEFLYAECRGAELSIRSFDQQNIYGQKLDFVIILKRKNINCCII